MSKYVNFHMFALLWKFLTVKTLNLVKVIIFKGK